MALYATSRPTVGLHCILCYMMMIVMVMRVQMQIEEYTVSMHMQCSADLITKLIGLLYNH